MSMVNRSLNTHGLSAAGRQALAVLEGSDGPLSPTVIAERMFVTTASTTSLLDTLEGRGLVTRLPDPSDRRRILVALTDAGRQAVDEFLPQIVALQTAALAGLGETERKRLIASLAVIKETVGGLDGAEIAAAAQPRRKRPRG